MSLPTLSALKQVEAYHGQVTEGKLYEGEDDADDGHNWFSGPLKFKRHIDDDLRKGSDGRRADDYTVFDPLKQMGAGSGNGAHSGGGGGSGSRGGSRGGGGSGSGGGGRIRDNSSYGGDGGGGGARGGRDEGRNRGGSDRGSRGTGGNDRRR